LALALTLREYKQAFQFWTNRLTSRRLQVQFQTTVVKANFEIRPGI
jgi:hypothetical protein